MEIEIQEQTCKLHDLKAELLCLNSQCKNKLICCKCKLAKDGKHTEHEVKYNLEVNEKLEELLNGQYKKYESKETEIKRKYQQIYEDLSNDIIENLENNLQNTIKSLKQVFQQKITSFVDIEPSLIDIVKIAKIQNLTNKQIDWTVNYFNQNQIFKNELATENLQPQQDSNETLQDLHLKQIEDNFQYNQQRFTQISNAFTQNFTKQMTQITQQISQFSFDKDKFFKMDENFMSEDTTNEIKMNNQIIDLQNFKSQKKYLFKQFEYNYLFMQLIKEKSYKIDDFDPKNHDSVLINQLLGLKDFQTDEKLPNSKFTVNEILRFFLFEDNPIVSVCRINETDIVYGQNDGGLGFIKVNENFIPQTKPLLIGKIGNNLIESILKINSHEFILCEKNTNTIMLFRFNPQKNKYEFKLRYQNNNQKLYNNSLKLIQIPESDPVIATAGDHQLSFFKPNQEEPLFMNTQMEEDIELIQPMVLNNNKYMVIVDDASQKGKINLSVYHVQNNFTQIEKILKIENPHEYPLRSLLYLDAEQVLLSGCDENLVKFWKVREVKSSNRSSNAKQLTFENFKTIRNVFTKNGNNYISDIDISYDRKFLIPSCYVEGWLSIYY